MDEWGFNLLLNMLGIYFDKNTQSCKEETKNSNSKTQKFCSDIPKNKKTLIYGIGPNSIPYEKILKVETYAEIQEGEFEEIEEIEDTETTEIAVI